METSAPDFIDTVAAPWREAVAEWHGLPAGPGLNIAQVLIDRHVAHGCGARPALRWIGRRGERREFTYAELARLSNRCANALAGLGVGRGDTVAVLAGRVPELVVAALAAWKLGAVFAPLLVAFGPEPIKARLQPGGAKVLIAEAGLYGRKIAPIRDLLPALRAVVLTGGPDVVPPPECLMFDALMAEAGDDFAVAATAADDPAFVHYTSGATGTPKGAVQSHAAVLSIDATARRMLGLRSGDTYWCTADPGWVTATCYGIVAPLSAGALCVLDQRDFDPKRWYGLLRDEAVNVWYTTPTALRMLMRSGTALARTYRFPALRLVASAGEPLNPEAVQWGADAFGVLIRDTWWQTETGCIAIGNAPDMTVKPGSMGWPVAGLDVALVNRDDPARLAVLTAAEATGEIAIRGDWPSRFRDYLGEPARFAQCFHDGWYLTGDLARRDADGYYWFLGRGDDVIKSAGHQIGPFEVESALMDHPAVADAAVIGVPDAMAYEVAKAFVTVNPGFEPGESLRRELVAFTRLRLGPVLAPREVVFIDDMPRTPSGKILRRLLKAPEPGAAGGSP